MGYIYNIYYITEIQISHLYRNTQYKLPDCLIAMYQ